jgi:hypothetical protein
MNSETGANGSAHHAIDSNSGEIISIVGGWERPFLRFFESLGPDAVRYTKK